MAKSSVFLDISKIFIANKLGTQNSKSQTLRISNISIWRNRTDAWGMEKNSPRKNSRIKITGEIKFVAERKQTIVVVPVVLEVIQLEVPIAIRVAIRVRHLAVAIGVLFKWYCNTPPVTPKAAPAAFWILFRVLLPNNVLHRLFDFFIKWRPHSQSLPCELLANPFTRIRWHEALAACAIYFPNLLYKRAFAYAKALQRI